MNAEKRFREKRKTQRLNIPVYIKYNLLPKKGVLHKIFSRDISGGGIRIALNHAIKKGERLRTFLHFPNDPKPVATVTKIARCRKESAKRGKARFDIGLRYIKISPKDRQRFVFLFCEMMLNYFILGQHRHQELKTGLGYRNAVYKT
jgi:c-di-GMP-binding flagellar brake protein YcgR